MCRTSIYDARNNFSALVKQAEEGEVIELTRYDKPVAVIINYDDWEEVKQSKPSLIDGLQKIKERYRDVLSDEDWVGYPSREGPDLTKNPFIE